MNLIVYEKLDIKPGNLIYLEKMHYTEGRNFQTFTHFHDMVEIIFFKNISGSVRINEYKYPLTNNTLVYVPSLAIHDYFYIPAVKDWIILQFRPEILPEIKFSTDAKLIGSHLVKTLTGMDEERMSLIFDWYLHINQNPDKTAMKNALLKLILSWCMDEIKIFNRGRKRVEEEVRGGISQFHPLLEYLNKNNVYNISLDHAADFIGITKFHFSRLFKKYFNVTFSEYLLQRKINSAITLLSETGLSIVEVSRRVGFNDKAYFSKVFKSRLKVTPSEFRKSIFIKT